MDDRWERLNALFHEALELEPQDRRVLLEERCDDLSLRRDVASLLEEAERDDGLLDVPLLDVSAADRLWDTRGASSEGGSLVGRTIDNKYRIDELRGRGGMGTVYRATHLGTERPVAVKIIAPEFMANPEFVERFRREALAAGRLRHPNVVNVTDFGFGRVAGRAVAYLVMEYLEGRTLAEMLEAEGRLDLGVAVDLVEQLCLAIDEAHRLGILHRDLKPENIWLEPNGRGGHNVKVLDFGLAKLRDAGAGPANREGDPLPASASPNATLPMTDRSLRMLAGAPPVPRDEAETAIMPVADRSTAADPTLGEIDSRTAPHWLTRVGMVLGTPKYMSPEQCRGGQLDAASDVYSIGVVAYQMLAGAPPFTGSTSELIVKHGEMPPPPLRSKRRRVSKAVETVVMSALAKEPGLRPASAGAFAAALRTAVGGDRSLGRLAGEVYRRHRLSLLRLAGWVAWPFVLVNAALMIVAMLTPSMPWPVAEVYYGAIWTAILATIVLANASTTAAVAEFVGRIAEEPREAVRLRPIVASTRRGLWRLATALAAVPFSRGRAGAALVAPVAIAEGLSGREASLRAGSLAAHVRPFAAATTARQAVVALAMVVVLQITLLFWGAAAEVNPARDLWSAPEYVAMFAPILGIAVALALVPTLRTTLISAVLYFRARAAAGDATVLAPLPEAGALVRPVRWPVLRTAAFVTACALALPAWQIFKFTMVGEFAESGEAGPVKALIASGQPLDVETRDGHPIVWDRFFRTSMVDLYLEEGGDPNESVFLRGTFPAEADRAGLVCPMIVAAARSGNAEAVQLLIARGASVEAVDQDGLTPLAAAAVATPKAVEPLLAAGADLNRRTEQGTALMAAARFWKTEPWERVENPVPRLIARGADANASDAQGRTPLMVMSMEHRPDAVIAETATALLDAGARLDARDAAGRTALMYAVKHRQRATVEFLLERGADATVKDRTGVTALALAIETGRADIVRLLNFTRVP